MPLNTSDLPLLLLTRINLFAFKDNYCLFAIFACFCFAGEATQLSFVNFSEELLVEASEKTFNVRGKPVIVKNLVVKTRSGVPLESLKSISTSIAYGERLYSGADFDYLSLVLDDQSLLPEIMLKMQTVEGVILVQPDILQLKPKPLHTRPQAESNNHKMVFYPDSSMFSSNKGSGVKVAIIDDGFDLQHAEFAQMRVSYGFDVEFGKTDPMPKIPTDNHGTKVLGILAAKQNESDVDGLIPDAEYVLIRQPSTWTSKTLKALAIVKRQNVDLVNCSWNSYWLIEPVADALNDLIVTGRNGKGLPLIFAAGNHGRELKENDIEASIEEVIVIGAKTEGNQRRNSSNWGRSVDLFLSGERTLSTLSGGGYINFAGTSLAATYASAEIARIISIEPELSLEQLVKKLQNIAISSSQNTH
jgi:subtilisin